MTEKEQTFVFSTNLRNLLQQKNLSQKEVAEKIGVTPQALNRWVMGLSLPRMDKIQKLARCLNIKKSDLIDPHEDIIVNDNNEILSPVLLTNIENQIITNYRAADETDKNSVHRILNIETEDKKEIELENLKEQAI